jgi:GNAT superfamily N-acetyltransferase
MNLTVIPARDFSDPPPEAVARSRLHGSVWAPPLSEEQYLVREAQIWRHPFSQGLRLWILHDGGEPVASCESYAVPALLARGERAGTAHGIASVFVEERRRGRGYAGALLQQVEGALRDEGALCAYLISEIGPGLYARLGYVARPLRCRRFSAPQPGEPEPGLDQVTWLGPDDLAPLLAARYRRPLRSPLTLLLTPAQIDWHLDRSRTYAALLGRPQPACVGARCGEAFALWMHDFRKELLRLLVLYPGEQMFQRGQPYDARSAEAAALRAVLHGARAEAAHAGLSAVEIWENATMSGWLRGGHQVASGDLPMLCPLARGVRAEDWLDWERGHWV